jgi:thiamine transport system ATP-binding protein
MLQVKNLFVDLGGFRLTADFEIERGSLISIVGPSGAGKSTILNALAGFIPLTSGVIKWNGSDITKLDPGLRPLSILFQDYNLFSHLTVKDNIAIGLRPNLKLDDLETEMVNSVIEEVGLSKFKFIKPFQLSGGQRTRVSLARSIVRSKPILLLDEAFSGLGPALRSEMIKLIKDKSIKEGITLIMVSHHIKDAIELDQKVIFVNDGETMKPTNVSIFINSLDENIRDYIGS